MAVKASKLGQTTIINSQQQIHNIVDRASRRLAPLWSLKNFVAVNPYLGFADHTFESTAQIFARRANAHLTAPRQFYAEAIQAGRITDADLEAALADHPPVEGALHNADALKAFALHDQPEVIFETLPTVAHIAGDTWAEFVTESISTWAGAYFDQGQSYWKSPWSNLPPYQAWQKEAAIDRTPEVRGIQGFRQIVATLPTSANETIEYAIQKLGISQEGLEAYLHRLLLTIHGWASYARYQLWDAELYNQESDCLRDLLAIRLVWELALLESFADKGIVSAWTSQKEQFASDALKQQEQHMLANELLLQRAFEKAYQRGLMATLSSTKQPAQTGRKQVQAAFCIDVRSEVFRRAFESTGNAVETIGFAGFFGFSIEYVRLGDETGGAQCPALITPQYVITEGVDGADANQLEKITHQRTMHQKITKAWRSFKMGAVSCFGFVGPVGLAYLKNLIQDTLGTGRPVPNPATFGLDADTVKRLKPSITLGEVGERSTGMATEDRINVAEGMLRAMSLTDNFARVVILAGHGSTTVNNPYATGLDCGACGGHSGEANARVAALVLNDADVRTGLVERGIHIPEDTIFIAAQHDTTTDEVTLFDTNAIPSSHSADIAQIEKQLAVAGQITRAERAALLGLGETQNIDAQVMKRSKDWSQVRPEWGLAGCAAFIVADRDHTRGVDLDGRSFLHNYSWQQDDGFGVLESIMTAPMVVTTWINLQYYASSVDNVVFGSGNKVLHNVVGTLGILEGNGGDLRVGLPWQSVHDGDNYVHEPLRLTVMIQAPIDAMNEIIEKHEAVRQLVDNGWMYLFALNDDGQATHQYTHNLNWTPVS